MPQGRHSENSEKDILKNDEKWSVPLLAECKDPSSRSDLLFLGNSQLRIGRGLRQESSFQSAIRSWVDGLNGFQIYGEFTGKYY